MLERRMRDASELAELIPAEFGERSNSNTSVKSFEKGDYIYRQGDFANSLYVVVEGRVSLQQETHGSKKSVAAILTENGLFGETNLFDNSMREVDALAMKPTVVREYPYMLIRQALERHPERLWVAAQLLTNRLREAEESVVDAMFLDVPARTAKHLLKFSKDSHEFTMPVNQHELAGLVGASRERVNKAMSLFSRLGWVEATGHNQMRLLNRPALENRAATALDA